MFLEQYLVEGTMLVVGGAVWDLMMAFKGVMVYRERMLQGEHSSKTLATRKPHTWTSSFTMIVGFHPFRETYDRWDICLPQEFGHPTTWIKAIPQFTILRGKVGSLLAFSTIRNMS